MILSWAFIEATVNELVDPRTAKDPLSRAFRHALGGTKNRLPDEVTDAWGEDQERLKTLDKYHAALTLCDAAQFEKGRPPYQPTALLAKLRNAIVHYTPELMPGHEEDRFEKKLQSQFRPNPNWPRANAYFPYKCLSADCARWAVNTAWIFVSEFRSRAGLEPNPCRWTDLSLPLPEIANGGAGSSDK